MTRAILCAIFVTGWLGVVPTAARTATDPLADFGGEEGLQRIIEDSIRRHRANPRIKRFFEKVDRERLTFLLFHRFCQALGGACTYKGRAMKDAHATLGIRSAHFNAAVEDLQAAMRAHRVPFRAQSRLLSRLAPMKRDIVTR